MFTISTDLEDRIHRLEEAFTAFADELHSAVDHLHTEAEVSVVKARTVLEGLLVELFVREMGKEPRKCEIGDMLADNQFTRKLDSVVLNKMTNVKNYGNIAIHVKFANAVQPPPHVHPKDAAKVLDDLCD